MPDLEGVPEKLPVLLGVPDLEGVLEKLPVLLGVPDLEGVPVDEGVCVAVLLGVCVGVVAWFAVPLGVILLLGV